MIFHSRESNLDNTDPKMIIEIEDQSIKVEYKNNKVIQFLFRHHESISATFVCITNLGHT
jgi:hypothetical protein